MANSEFDNKTILITGGTGSIGSALVKELLPYNPKQIRIFSRDQNKQYELMEELGDQPHVRFLVGDIRDENRLNLALNNVDIVFHAAALKHVPSCEYNPFEAVKTNIIGSQNIIEAALEHNVDKVIGISTDKVVYPTSVMGTSKLMMEKLFSSAYHYMGQKNTKFACVRFGNVAWSTASVLPIW
ncbi:MAG: SDR family NAD(P)-dependent oxidoreductase, partial [Candidatus Taylorbacteria bacterium]|nr:SDR family NAD(P)-dependent oxidoreductase [Candidatus Taylorbacteria bacterium]